MKVQCSSGWRPGHHRLRAEGSCGRQWRDEPQEDRHLQLLLEFKIPELGYAQLTSSTANNDIFVPGEIDSPSERNRGRSQSELTEQHGEILMKVYYRGPEIVSKLLSMHSSRRPTNE